MSPPSIRGPPVPGVLFLTGRGSRRPALSRSTSRYIYTALVWQDTRTAGFCAELAGQGGQDRFRQKTGLPLSTYFSGPKIFWLLMQFQADIPHVPVTRPKISETTALGAAYVAGLAVGFWSNPEELRRNWQADKTWQPHLGEEQRDRRYRGWQKAVTRTFDWID